VEFNSHFRMYKWKNLSIRIRHKNYGNGIGLLTYLLIPWSRIILKKLTGFQLFKKFPAFYLILFSHLRLGLPSGFFPPGCHLVFFYPARQGTEGNSRHSERNIRGTCTIVFHRQKLGGPV